MKKKDIFNKLLFVFLFLFMIIFKQNKEISSIGEFDYYCSRQAVFNSTEIVEEKLMINKLTYKSYLENSILQIKNDHHLTRVQINYTFRYLFKNSVSIYCDEIYVQICYYSKISKLIHNYHFILEKL